MTGISWWAQLVFPLCGAVGREVRGGWGLGGTGTSLVAVRVVALLHRTVAPPQSQSWAMSARRTQAVLLPRRERPRGGRGGRLQPNRAVHYDTSNQDSVHFMQIQPEPPGTGPQPGFSSREKVLVVVTVLLDSLLSLYVSALLLTVIGLTWPELGPGSNSQVIRLTARPVLRTVCDYGVSLLNINQLWSWLEVSVGAVTSHLRPHTRTEKYQNVSDWIDRTLSTAAVIHPQL